MHTHSWRKVHEEFLLEGTFPVGWECTTCNTFVALTDLTPEGLNGMVTKQHKLRGPCRGLGRLSDGTLYREQIVHEDGSLEIIR